MCCVHFLSMKCGQHFWVVRILKKLSASDIWKKCCPHFLLMKYGQHFKLSACCLVILSCPHFINTPTECIGVENRYVFFCLYSNVCYKNYIKIENNAIFTMSTNYWGFTDIGSLIRTGLEMCHQQKWYQADILAIWPNH